MSEGAGAAASPAAGPTAGRLLREARERQGLHIAALAAAIKVAPRKLELLESDRFDQLPDATFARALAQTVCRALKIDPAAVMRLLPPPSGYRLEQVGEGLNAPFRDRSNSPGPFTGASLVASPAFWLTALILLAALGVYLLPASLGGLATSHRHVASAPAAARAAAPPSAPAPAAPAPVEAASAIAPAAVPAGSAADAGAPAASEAMPAALGVALPGVLQLQVTAESWIEVVDARGQSLLSRLVRPGEEIGLDGTAPFRLRIGNAGGTRVVFRGQPIDLTAFTRDNVARLELK